ncbi:MAG TPA: sulfite exporter TauE/SafE family protein [Azospirillum sp.]|nr:sulfite exporter TauE/SafE family protein [Azospirillum sp.]
MTDYLVFFLAGLAGSFHCAGMCGGFACALGISSPGHRWTMIGRQALYNTGRVVTYAFLGALAGAAGQAICTAGGMAIPTLDGAMGTGQRLLATASGALMIVMALPLLGLRRVRVGFAAPGLAGMAGSLRTVLATPAWPAPLAFGVLNGFLPCPLVYAFAVQAAAGADPVSGALTMAAFGAGTIPAMAAIGAVGRLAGPMALRWGVRTAGVFILALGLVTIGRGMLFPAFHGHLMS